MGMMAVKATVDETKSFEHQKSWEKVHNGTLCVKDHSEKGMDVHYSANGNL